MRCTVSRSFVVRQTCALLFVAKERCRIRNADPEVVKTFSGTDLERYFANVGYGGTPALYLRLNQYAHQRFPHNPVFVRNLLGAYHDSHTYDDAAWQCSFASTGLKRLTSAASSSNICRGPDKLSTELMHFGRIRRLGQNQWVDGSCQSCCRGISGAGELMAVAFRGQARPC